LTSDFIKLYHSTADKIGGVFFIYPAALLTKEVSGV